MKGIQNILSHFDSKIPAESSSRSDSLSSLPPDIYCDLVTTIDKVGNTSKGLIVIS